MKTYSASEVITEAGDTCRDLLLIAGDASIPYQLGEQIKVEQVHLGQMLDELEVLTRRNAENTSLGR